MTGSAGGVRSYRQLFAIREFRVLFANRCIVMASVAAGGLALATVIYDATGSPVLTSMSMLGGPLVSLVASQFLLAGSDVVRPRTAMMLQLLGALAADLLQFIPDQHWPLRFLWEAIPFVVNSAFAGTQWAVLRELVPDESYVLGRSTLNLATGGMQVLGYGLGGLLLVWLAPRELFLAAAAADAIGLVNVRLGLRDRPARGSGSGGLARRTMSLNRVLLGSPVTRPIYCRVSEVG